MPDFEPQSIAWKSNRAVVLVHGVGSYTKPNYDGLIAALESAVGKTEWKKVAVYTTLYDVFNDWAAEKTQCATLAAQLVSRLKFHYDSGALGEVAAEGAGDVVWPVLSMDVRHCLRDAIVAQLQRVVLDGDRAGYRRAEQKITILCHSLGCFHTYEALACCARDERQRLMPIADAVQFDNVVMFASPVQLIRTVSGWLGRLVPEADDLACLIGSRLERLGETNLAGRFVPSTRRFVSVTGELDPVGGFLFRRQLPWAYMDVREQESHVDDQTLLDLPTPEDLTDALMSAIGSKKGLPFSPENPHDWIGYVERNGALVKECVLS